MKKKIVTSLTLVILLGIGLFIGSTPVSGDDWIMPHHDARRSGYSTSEAPDAPNLLWSYGIGGQLLYSPVIANGKVFVGSSFNTVYCLDETTGELIWRKSFGASVRDRYPTIVAADGKLFVNCNGVYCLNIETGEIIWNDVVLVGNETMIEVFPKNLELYSKFYNQLGPPKFMDTGRTWTGRSLVVANDKVFIGDYDVYCLDKNTGKFIWKHPHGWLMSDIAVADDMVFVCSADKKVNCLDENTGDLIWSYETKGYAHAPPVVVDGRVFVCPRENKLYCLDEISGRLIWSYKTENIMFPPLAVAYGKVFVGLDNRVYRDDDKICCIDEYSGKLVWEHKFDELWGSDLAVADDKLFVLARERSRDGKAHGKLYCLDENTGKLVWCYDLRHEVGGASLAVADGKVFVNGYDGNIYCFGSLPYTQKQPGFEAILAIAGLLAMVYLLRRRK